MVEVGVEEENSLLEVLRGVRLVQSFPRELRKCL